MKILGRKNSAPAPDFMPVLSKGDHLGPHEGACMMEYISVLAGEKFSDDPRCVNPYIASIGRILNDRSYDNRLSIIRLMGPAMATGTGDSKEDHIRSYRLQEWALDSRTVSGREGFNVDFLEKIIAKYHEWYGTDPHIITKAEVKRVEKVGLPA